MWHRICVCGLFLGQPASMHDKLMISLVFIFKIRVKVPSTPIDARGRSIFPTELSTGGVAHRVRPGEPVSRSRSDTMTGPLPRPIRFP